MAENPLSGVDIPIFKKGRVTPARVRPFYFPMMEPYSVTSPLSPPSSGG